MYRFPDTLVTARQALLAIFPFDGVVACRSHTPFSLDRSIYGAPTWSLPVWLETF
jgi:hypothetical protein